MFKISLIRVLNPKKDFWTKLLALVVTLAIMGSIYNKTYGDVKGTENSVVIPIEWAFEEEESYCLDRKELPNTCRMTYIRAGGSIKPENLILHMNIGKQELDFYKENGRLIIYPSEENLMEQKSGILGTKKRVIKTNGINMTNVRFMPADIHITSFDEKITEEIPVIPILLEQEIPFGFELVKSEVKEKVLVTGPKKLIRKQETVKTTPISLKGASSTFSQEVLLDPPQSLLKYSHSKVNVTVEIKELAREIFTGIPIRVLIDANTNLRLSSSEKLPVIDISVNHPKGVNPTESAVTAYIDVTKISNPGIYRIPVQCFSSESDLNLIPMTSEIMVNLEKKP